MFKALARVSVIASNHPTQFLLPTFLSFAIIMMSASASSNSVTSASQTCDTNTRMPVLFISHFGGPNFYMDWRKHGDFFKLTDTNSKFAQEFRGMRQKYGWVDGGKYGKPKALVLVSAHWITKQVSITGQDKYPSLFYDYGGFGIDDDDVTYPAPGDLQLATQIQSMLSKSGIPASIDNKRNLDHGVFNVLHVLFPDADIPVLQVSILRSYDPATHVALGKALAPLRDQGILIIGSGEMTHNFAPTKKEDNLAFSEAMRKILEDSSISPSQREQHLINWESLPKARIAHAQEDHLIPLHVIVGAANGTPGKRILAAEMGIAGRAHFVADSYMFE